jgi:hypothetical protein
MLNKICTRTAKSAPYPPCTPAAHYARAGRSVTAFWLKYQVPARMQHRVTQPPHIPGPLAVSDLAPINNFSTFEERLN